MTPLAQIRNFAACARRSRAAVIALRDHRDFLADIVGACRSLIRFVEGMTIEA